MIKKEIKIFLDDKRTLDEIYNSTKDEIYNDNNWYIVRNYSNFVKLIKELDCLPSVISFDHDLGDYSGENGKELTGYDALKFFLDYLIEIEKVKEAKKINFIFHTSNNIGYENMKHYLKNWKRFNIYYL